MNARTFAAALSLALAACAGTPGDRGADPPDAGETKVASSTATATPAEAPSITFLDSYAFDRDLSDALGARPAELHVATPERFGLNHIPPRLEKWLSAVKDSGGTVKAQPVPPPDALAMRGFLGLAIDLVVALFDSIRQGILYRPARDYDVVLYYQPDTGLVEDTVFRRRAS